MVSSKSLARGLAKLALLAAFVLSGTAALADGPLPGRWVASWATGPAGPTPGGASQFSDQTIRYIVHTSAGGDRVRVRISNTFGTDSLVLGSVHIARRADGAGIDPRTDRQVSFGGAGQVTVPAGALVLSDPVDLDVPALSDLAVSVYLPRPTVTTTMHAWAIQTNYIAAGNGDVTGARDLPGASTVSVWHFLTGVDVSRRGCSGAVVALGDSITDGANSTPDANLRWPNVLAQRLQARPWLSGLGVIDQGVIGNRILHATEPQFGNLFAPPALARFDRDVLAQAGVEYVIVLLGINDIGHPGGSAPLSEEVTAEQIEGGLMQMAARAHEKGIKIFVSTLTPFENTTLADFYSPEKELKRQAVNAWIRSQRRFDAVIDFDAVIRDPSHPARILPAYDGGDHLHPSDAGHEAMGEAIPLSLFGDYCR